VLFPTLLRSYEKVGATRFVLLLGSVNVAYRLLIAELPLPSQPIGEIELASLLSYQLPGRILEFALGMRLADLYLHKRDYWKARFAWAWIPLLPVALWCRAAGPRFLADPVMGVLYFTITASVVLCIGPRTTGITSFVEEHAAAFGRASYSFFLIHLPVLDVLARVWPADYAHPYSSFARLFVVGFLSSAGIAAALYHGIELPVWKRMRTRAVRERESSAATVMPASIAMMAATPAEQQVL
jgi:peptidoglycan/LPS O-acetylase OafA/YrhL